MERNPLIPHHPCRRLLQTAVLFIGVVFGQQVLAQATLKGSVDNFTLHSKALNTNRLNLTAKRAMSVYLPPGYHSNPKQHYPVVYYIPHGRVDLTSSEHPAALEAAFDRGLLKECIFVTGDFSIPNSLNFFGNNAVTGRWLDFIQQEWVNEIDKRYRTLKHPNSRAITGHFLGGYAAMKTAIYYPDTFSVLYTLHPVGTGFGTKVAHSIPNWETIHSTTDPSALTRYDMAFVAMAQAHSPNPNRPPLYANLLVEKINGKQVVNAHHAKTLWLAFSIDNHLLPNLDKVQKLKAIGFDWGRLDRTEGHVISNRSLSRLLTEFGIDHSAIENNGNGWDYSWSVEEAVLASGEGSTARNMLPFLNHHLAFD